jgi:hypothetical protein
VEGNKENGKKLEWKTVKDVDKERGGGEIGKQEREI